MAYEISQSSFCLEIDHDCQVPSSLDIMNFFKVKFRSQQAQGQLKGDSTFKITNSKILFLKEKSKVSLLLSVCSKVYSYKL